MIEEKLSQLKDIELELRIAKVEYENQYSNLLLFTDWELELGNPKPPIDIKKAFAKHKTATLRKEIAALTCEYNYMKRMLDIDE